jgi:hypothetical protein
MNRVILFDSMMMSGLRWVLSTVAEAALAELNDDTALRAALQEAGVRLELGEITEAEYLRVEGDVLARIAEIRASREGDAGPIAWTGPQDAPGEGLGVEASVVGDFHEPAAPESPALARLQRTKAARRRKGRITSPG